MQGELSELEEDTNSAASPEYQHFTNVPTTEQGNLTTKNVKSSLTMLNEARKGLEDKAGMSETQRVADD